MKDILFNVSSRHCRVPSEYIPIPDTSLNSRSLLQLRRGVDRVVDLLGLLHRVHLWDVCLDGRRHRDHLDL